MVLCVIAFVVFGLLSVFSARYRPLAREAFDCTLRKLTFRPCASNLDARLKARAVARLLTVSPRAARLLRKHFELLLTLLTLLFFVSLLYSAVSVYNWVAYGNCNGPNSSAGCVLPPLYARSAAPGPNGSAVIGAAPLASNSSNASNTSCPPHAYSPYLPYSSLNAT